LLVTPLEFSEIKSPLLAYDGSQRASAAMHVAAEVCSQLGLPLSVLTVCRDVEQGEKILDQARRYLASYSLETHPYVVTGQAYEAHSRRDPREHYGRPSWARTDTAASSAGSRQPDNGIRAAQRAPARVPEPLTRPARGVDHSSRGGGATPAAPAASEVRIDLAVLAGQ
jgi:hypothetical protein